jgi:hypothetical protein
MHRAIRRGQIVGDCVMWTTIIAILVALLLAP